MMIACLGAMLKMVVTIMFTADANDFRIVIAFSNRSCLQIQEVGGVDEYLCVRPRR